MYSENSIFLSPTKIRTTLENASQEKKKVKRSSELMGTIDVCFDVWSIWALFKIDRHEKAERSLLSSLNVGRLSCQATYEDMNGGRTIASVEIFPIVYAFRD